MKIKNVILLSLLLSTLNVFAVESKTEKKSSNSLQSKEVKKKSAYDSEKEKKVGKKKKMKDLIGEKSAMDKQKTNKKPTEL